MKKSKSKKSKKKKKKQNSSVGSRIQCLVLIYRLHLFVFGTLKFRKYHNGEIAFEIVERKEDAVKLEKENKLECQKKKRLYGKNPCRSFRVN